VVAEGPGEDGLVVEIGIDGGDFQYIDDRAMAAGEVVINDGRVAFLLEALDRVRPDISTTAGDENVHLGAPKSSKIRRGLSTKGHEEEGEEFEISDFRFEI
jgi:hypothetical protein